MTVIEPTPQPQQGDIIHTDAVIIGAGPVGLFAVFELGLLNLKAHLIDNLDKIGGQCAELYPEKPIYDIPAFPQITGQELTDNLLEQIKPFDPQFHLNQQAAEVKRLENGNWFVRTTADTTFETPNVIIAAGAGSFVPRRPPLKGLDAFENKSVYYAVRNRAEFVGKRLVIAGGGDSALDWTLNLLPDVEHLTLVHRRDDFRAHPDSVSKMREAVAAGKMDLKIGQIKDVVGEDGQVEKLIFQSSKKEMEEISANRFLAFYGLKTELGPIAQWGLGLESNMVKVDTEKFETNEQGIFAIGDICWYPGKLKLILSGFHEGALMAQEAFRRARPDEKLVFRYTTSSSALHETLGVA